MTPEVQTGTASDCGTSLAQAPPGLKSSSLHAWFNTDSQTTEGDMEENNESHFLLASDAFAN